MNRRRAALCIIPPLILLWAGAVAPFGSAPEFPEEAQSAMFGFLDAWLVQKDQARTVTHFSASGNVRMLAPKSVLNAPGGLYNGLSSQQRDVYWQTLGQIGVPHGFSLDEILAPIDPDLKTALVEELMVTIVHEQPFTVFVADSELAIDSFDGGYGDVAEALLPTQNVVLTMIADFADRGHKSYMGPFVSFWSTDAIDDDWRIQALGAAPEGEMWRDGR